MAWQPESSYQANEIKKRRLTHPEAGLDRLWLATEIEKLNTLIGQISETQWEGIEKRAGPDLGDASSKLRRIRLALSLIQGSYKSRVRVAAAGLAALFVCAVVALEVHAEFELTVALVLYIVAFALILSLYLFARHCRLQQYMENYRAASEALRVQLSWWDAGLLSREHRVERTYLTGSIGSLAGLRTAVRHFVDAALLQWGDPKPVPGNERRWLDSQIGYFREQIRKRKVALSRVEKWSWCLFLGSFGLAVLLAILVFSGIWEGHTAHKVVVVVMVMSAAIAGGLRYFSERLSQEHELFSYRDAHGTFLLAQEELDALGEDPSPAAQQKRLDILAAVGREALEENEAWIRAHRVRPLEPIIGG
jgi:hypothetical protein